MPLYLFPADLKHYDQSQGNLRPIFDMSLSYKVSHESLPLLQPGSCHRTANILPSNIYSSTEFKQTHNYLKIIFDLMMNFFQQSFIARDFLSAFRQLSAAYPLQCREPEYALGLRGQFTV
jgi:hypothetical protein